MENCRASEREREGQQNLCKALLANHLPWFPRHVPHHLHLHLEAAVIMSFAIVSVRKKCLIQEFTKGVILVRLSDKTKDTQLKLNFRWTNKLFVYVPLEDIVLRQKSYSLFTWSSNLIGLPEYFCLSCLFFDKSGNTRATKSLSGVGEKGLWNTDEENFFKG